jgi:putative FmdB family regulatory protein
LPIYEYECASCGSVVDIKHGFKETTEDVCRACGGALRRLFKPAGIVFKGSGFYVTDSRKSSESKSDAPKSDAPKSDASKSESTSATSDSTGTKNDSGSKSDSGGKGDAAA